MRRTLLVLLAFVALVVAAAPVPARSPAPPPPIAELLARVNDTRADHGLPPVALRRDVEDIAGRHSVAMSGDKHLRHNDAYFSRSSKRALGARALGENVAYAGSVEQAHHALMASPDHRKNILDRRWTVIGLGAVDDGELWWITQDFVQPR
ncbi:MAG TPA: CAP domain-containing protein [Acidimicrobiales bacterium]|nr:CAP domain-containing protein [Acidimicrobiales bacterium]